jgi:fatty acid amide hydrolase 2
VDLRDLTVLVVEGNGLVRVSPDLKASLHRAADVLRRRGAKIETVWIPQLRRSLELWSGRMSAASALPFQTLLGEGTPIPLAREFLKWTRRKSAHTFPALALAALEKIPYVTPKDPTPVIAAARALRDELSGRLGERGVLLFPPYTRSAPRHGWPMAAPIDWVYTAVFNALELPVTQVPAGLDGHGLPLGVQVVGAHGQDHVTLAVAQALEQGLGGWVWPRV